MDYKEATDRLFKRITAADLAEELGVSQNTVARARLDPTTRDYRPPPSGWESALVKIANRRIEELRNLRSQIES